jgi:hypothetical protein
MRKLGYILLVVGFVWSVFFSIEAGPVARAYCTKNRQKMAEHQLATAEDVAVAYTDTAFRVSSFAQRGVLGSLVMLAGGIILAKFGRRDSPASKPPVL